MDNIKDFLTNRFDLSEGEAEVYLKLVEIQPSTVLELSKATGINRITVHGYIEKLIERGLISQTKRGSRRQLITQPPDKFSAILDRKARSIQETENLLPSIVQQIKKLSPSSNEKELVKVEYHEGKKAVSSIYKEALSADKVYSYVHLERYIDVFPDTLTDWWKALRKNPKREVWDILIDSPIARKNITEDKFQNYHAKILPKPERFSGFRFADYLIYGDKVAIMQLDPKEIEGTVIQSKHVASSFKALHQTLWDLLPERQPT